MTILGNDNIESSDTWMTALRMMACMFTSPGVSGNSSIMSFYCSDGNDDGKRLHMGIYSDNGADHPETLLEDLGIIVIDAPAWQIDASNIAIAASTKYHLICMPESSETNARYKAGASNQCTINGANLTFEDPLPETFPLTGHAHQDREYSIYVEYSAGEAAKPSGGSVIPVLANVGVMMAPFKSRFPRFAPRMVT